MTESFDSKQHGYWKKYHLPRLPVKKRNKIDSEEQLRFEKLQLELVRIMNEVANDDIDGFHWRTSIACKRRNGKLYIRLLYDRRHCWSVTDYMVDLHKKLYKSSYSTRSPAPRNDGVTIENSEFYREDILRMIIDFIHYSELKCTL